jgi:hypothetical protein
MIIREDLDRWEGKLNGMRVLVDGARTILATGDSRSLAECVHALTLHTHTFLRELLEVVHFEVEGMGQDQPEQG